MKRPIKSKKDTISDLEYALTHLTFYPSKAECLNQVDNIYNILMFYFGVSEKKLNRLITKTNNERL